MVAGNWRKVTVRYSEKAASFQIRELGMSIGN